MSLKECAKKPRVDEKGYVLYYTSQCPFNAKYVPVIEGIAKEKSIQFKAIHLRSKEEAQNAPTPITTYALFLDGNYITNELLDKEGITVLTMPSSELSRGRGGPRCMSCPVNREDL